MRFTLITTIEGECPDDAEPEEVVARLRDVLQGVSQEQRAKVLNISGSYLSLILAGKRPLPTGLREKMIGPVRVAEVGSPIYWFSMRETVSEQ